MHPSFSPGVTSCMCSQKVVGRRHAHAQSSSSNNPHHAPYDSHHFACITCPHLIHAGGPITHHALHLLSRNPHTAREAFCLADPPCLLLSPPAKSGLCMLLHLHSRADTDPLLNAEGLPSDGEVLVCVAHRRLALQRPG